MFLNPWHERIDDLFVISLIADANDTCAASRSARLAHSLPGKKRECHTSCRHCESAVEYCDRSATVHLHGDLEEPWLHSPTP